MKPLAPIASLDHLQRRLALGLAVVAGLLLFASYPLAALSWLAQVVPLGPLAKPSWLNWSLPFQVRLPETLWLTCLAVPLLVVATSRPRRDLAWALGIYGAACAAHAWRSPWLPVEWSAMLALAAVPAAVAAAARDGEWFSVRHCAGVGGALWLVQMLAGTVAVLRGQEVLGLAGNRNWMAATLLAAAPWAALALLQRWRRWSPAPRRTTCVLLVAAVVVPTVWLVAHCDSRGAWLALLGLSGLLLWLPARWYQRLALAVLAAVALLAAVVIAQRQVLDALERDVRIPLIGRTVALIAEHDVIAAGAAALATRSLAPLRELREPMGVGPGRFRATFAPYRARSTYGEREVAAAITVHPHNELLYIAATLGVPALLAWLWLLVPLVRRPVWPDARTGCARCAAWLLLVHGLVDMTLVQPPCNVLFLLCLGLTWAPHWQPGPPRRDGPALRWRASLAWLALLLALLVVLAATPRHWRSEWQQRRALIAERQGNATAARDAYLAAATVSYDPVLALYQVGRLELERLDRPREALARFEQVRRREPAFAHLHLLRGAAHLALGEIGPATAAYAEECWLFPYSIGAWQAYYHGATVTDLAIPPQAFRDKLDALYRHHARQTAGGTEALHRQVLAWWQAVRSGDEEAALRAAETLTADWLLPQADPLLLLASGSTPWPRQLILAGYNPGDYLYWRQLAWAEELVATAPPPGTAEALAWLVHGCASRYRADAPPDFTPPEALWRRGHGDAPSVYAALAVLGPPLGFRVALYRDAAGGTGGAIATAGDRRWQIVLQTGALDPLAADATPPWTGPGQTYFPFQALLLKNRILGVLAADALPTLRVDAATPPAQALRHAAADAAGAPVPFLRLHDYLWPIEIDAIRQRLTPPTPAP